MDRDWPRLGRYVRERRESLGLAQGSDGPSSATWRKVEQATKPPYKATTLRAISRALGWTSDSADRILAGREPVEERRGTATSVITTTGHANGVTLNDDDLDLEEEARLLLEAIRDLGEKVERHISRRAARRSS